MSEIKVDTVVPRTNPSTLTIGAAGDTINIAGTAGTGFPAGTTINNNADNRVITGSGTSGTLNGESNLTFDGDNLLLSADYPDFKIQDADAAANSYIQFQQVGGGSFIKARSNTNDGELYIGGGVNSGTYAKFGPNLLSFYSQNTEKARMFTGGVTAFSSGIALGVGVADTASHVLDDYEEGSFNPSWSVQGGGSLGAGPTTNQGFYTKVGRACTISIMSYILATTGTITSYTCTNLPFQSAPNTVAPSMGQEFGQTGYGMLCVNSQNDVTVVIKKYDASPPPANAYMRVCFTYQTV